MYMTKLWVFLLLFAGLNISCTDKKSKLGEIDLASLATVTPKALTNFDKADSLYFSHLAYKSISLGSNRTIIADRQNKFVALVDDKGNLISKIREGRGPGEILDVYEMTKTSNNTIYFNDSDNKKILIFNEELDFIKEFKPKPYDGTAITSVFPGEGGQYIFELNSFDFLENEDEERKKVFVQYDLNNEEYGKEFSIKDRPYARTYLDGNLVGASQVPFSDIALTAYNSRNHSLFVYETSKSKIIEVDVNFDTLRTIPVNLLKQKLSETEIDSLRAGERNERWKTMREYLPEFKSVAERFFYNDNQFWIESNLRGDYQKWFVLNMEGQIIKVVHLPKDGMVTHISDDNIGIRMSDSEFALYRNQKLEIAK